MIFRLLDLLLQGVNGSDGLKVAVRDAEELASPCFKCGGIMKNGFAQVFIFLAFGLASVLVEKCIVGIHLTILVVNHLPKLLLELGSRGVVR